MLDLVKSDNKLLSRLLVSLAAICDEVSLLVSEARNDFYISIVGYEEGTSVYDKSKCRFCKVLIIFLETGNLKDSLQGIGKFLDKLQKIYCFVNRTEKVVTLLLNQLCAILGKGFYTGNTTSFPVSQYFSYFLHVILKNSVQEPLECLAELLVCLMTLETLLISSPVKDQFMVYHKMVKKMVHNNTKINITSQRLRLLDLHLSHTSALFTGDILKVIFKHVNNDIIIFLLSPTKLFVFCIH